MEPSSNPNSLTSVQKKDKDEASTIPLDKSPKFVRSKDRCHALTRTPIYDNKGNLLCYNFRYTAGEGSFRPDVLEKKHVKHVIMGFYVRRHSDLFTQQNAICMTEFPLCPEVTKYSKPLPSNRFILHLTDRQDSSASYQHQVNMLKRDGMTIAADVYTIVYTNWFRELRSISYAVIDMTQDIEEQFILARNIVKKAPWIKIICDRCDNVNKASIAFETGADYVCCSTFPKDVLKANFNPYQYKANRNTFEKALYVLLELLEDRPDYNLFIELVNSRIDIKSLIPMILAQLEQGRDDDLYYAEDFESSLYDMDSEVLHKLICIICLMLLEEYYRPDTDRDKGKYIRYEPLKQILVRAKFIEELVSYKSAELDVSWAFGIGVCSQIALMYAYTTNSIDEYLSQISGRLMTIFEEYPDFEVVLKIAQSIESLDLEYVDGIMAADIFSRHDILFSYENALMWTASLVDLMNQKRY